MNSNWFFPWVHIRRTPYQSLSAIITMFLTILLTGVVGISAIASQLVLQHFEGKPQLTVFFLDKAGKEEADALSKKLEETGKIASIKFVSKDDALGIYREQNKNDPLLLEMVTADILPASLEVTAREPSMLKELEQVIKGSSGVEEVVFQREVVDTLVRWTNGIRIVGGGFLSLLLLNTLLTLMTVIGMKIALRRDELEILTLLGASPWYIRRPFYSEGMWYGIISAVSASVLLIGGIIFLRVQIVSLLGIVPIIKGILSNPTSELFLMFSACVFSVLLFFGMFLGIAGSMIAMSRFHRS